MILIDQIKNIYENELIPLCDNILNKYSDGNIAEVNALMPNLTDVINKCIPFTRCSSVIFTLNTDKVLFGVRVNPYISNESMIKIILDAGDVVYDLYEVELDSKLLDYSAAEEIAAYLIEEICSILNPAATERVKDIIAVLIAEKDGSIKFRESVYYTNIIEFAFKTTLNNVASLLYKDKDAIGMLEIPNGLELGEILRITRDNLARSVYGIDEPETAPNLGVLQWALMVYEDIKLNIQFAKRVLNDALISTGSVIEIKLINETLKSLDKAFSQILVETENLENNYLQELSLFKAIKSQGLKSIEADLYEFKLQAKNCVEQEEALYIIRQINTRIGIIEDYIATEQLTDAEKNKWMGIDMEYRELRSELAKKKLSMRKNIGYYVDYDKLEKDFGE